MDKIQDRIASEIASSAVVLYIKGTHEAPMCGFSRAVMNVFDNLGVEYKTVDVLADSEIREGIKVFTQWPTIPQVFIKGQFIGGCDIVRELHQKGELQKLVNDA